MNFASLISTQRRTGRPQRRLQLVCIAALALALGSSSLATAAVTSSSTQTGQLEGAPSKPSASATLQQCLTAPTQAERSATFAGEMTAIAGTARMEMRIDVLERLPAGIAYRTVTAPGLGVWSSSAPGVKTYRNLNKVVNLAAPAFYRAAVRFRWINARGKLLKATELRTRRCEQSVLTEPETETPPTSSPKPGAAG